VLESAENMKLAGFLPKGRREAFGKPTTGGHMTPCGRGCHRRRARLSMGWALLGRQPNSQWLQSDYPEYWGNREGELASESLPAFVNRVPHGSRRPTATRQLTVRGHRSRGSVVESDWSRGLADEWAQQPVQLALAVH